MLSRDVNSALLDVNGTRIRAHILSLSEAELCLSIDGRDHILTNKVAILESANVESGGGMVLAPMHGALLEIFVSEGEAVTKGQRLAILEAMKMQHEILAEVDGTVSGVHVNAGTQIAADTIMIEIEETET